MTPHPLQAPVRDFQNYLNQRAEQHESQTTTNDHDPVCPYVDWTTGTPCDLGDHGTPCPAHTPEVP